MTKRESEELTSKTCIRILSIKTAVKLSVSIHMSKDVSEAVARILSHLDVKVHMKPKHTLRSILSHAKDQIPEADKSNVIYKIGGRDRDASYVGKTSSALKTRLSEHKKAVEKADFSSSALAEHAWSHNHLIDWMNTGILNIESCYHLRLTREAIHIRRQSVSLNRNRGCL